MSDEQEDDQSKTYEPTARRIEDAIAKGYVAFSKEVTSFLFLLFLTITIALVLPYLAKELFAKLTFYFQNFNAYNFDNSIDITRIAKKVVMDGLLIIATPLLLNITASLLGAILQNGIIFAKDALEPNLDKINPIKGLGRILSKKNLAEFIKGVVKVVVIAFGCFIVIKSDAIYIANSIHDLGNALYILMRLLLKIMIMVSIIMAFIAAVDYFIERHFYMQNLMMTKEELKEELKQTEGRPEIKSKQRKVMAARAKNRIAVAVPKATVVITNPTHYSVALFYNEGEVDAPKVVAKGVDEMAFQIRKLAKKHDIPIVENPPLARALYDSVEVDDIIPFDFYKAVAKILSKIIKPKKRRM